MVRNPKILIIRGEPGSLKSPPADLLMDGATGPAGHLTGIEHVPLERDWLRERPPDKKAEAKPRGRALILVVEPDMQIAGEYERIFRNEGHDMEVASSVTEAVKKLKNLSFECIVVDVDLPDMAGYDAVSVIKTMQPKTNIIITAAKNTKELEARIRKEDIFYYYIKSFDREELRLAVRNAVTRCEREEKSP
jgi:CheY-like chemotaxis protein